MARTAQNAPIVYYVILKSIGRDHWAALMDVPTDLPIWQKFRYMRGSREVGENGWKSYKWHAHLTDRDRTGLDELTDLYGFCGESAGIFYDTEIDGEIYRDRYPSVHFEGECGADVFVTCYPKGFDRSRDPDYDFHDFDAYLDDCEDRYAA